MVASVKRPALSRLASNGRALSGQRQNSARAVKQPGLDQTPVKKGNLAGGEGRNRPYLAIPKPLEINDLLHR